MMIAGQATRPMAVPYQAGTSSVVISLVPGAFLSGYPGTTLLDKTELLPNANDSRFLLEGEAFLFPTFDTAEKLIDDMARRGLIDYDEIVIKATGSGQQPLSDRAVQRHFSKTTGLSPKKLRQIKQAQLAVRLLKKGEKPADAAAEAGYSDQPHLSKSLRRIMGSKPSDVEDIHKI